MPPTPDPDRVSAPPDAAHGRAAARSDTPPGRAAALPPTAPGRIVARLAAASGRAAALPPTMPGRTAAQSDTAPPLLLRRRVRLARRHLGPGPYLDYGCGRGELLALLATRGSAMGFVADPVLAELARTAAPGCPVHTNPDALPAGVFRGVLAVTTTPPEPATLATWRRVLVPGGRVLVVGAVAQAEGFTLRWTGREGWRRGVPAAVLESA